MRGSRLPAGAPGRPPGTEGRSQSTCRSGSEASSRLGATTRMLAPSSPNASTNTTTHTAIEGREDLGHDDVHHRTCPAGASRRRRLLVRGRDVLHGCGHAERRDRQKARQICEQQHRVGAVESAKRTGPIPEGDQSHTDDGAGDREEHDECQVGEEAHPSSCARTRIPKDETHTGGQCGTDCCQQQTITDRGAGSFDGRRPGADAGRFTPQQRNGNNQREGHDTHGRRHAGCFPRVKECCTMTPRQPARCRHQPLSANADSNRRHGHR